MSHKAITAKNVFVWAIVAAVAFMLVMAIAYPVISNLAAEYLGINQNKAAPTSGTSFPSNPTLNQAFYRTDLGQTYTWNGQSWVPSSQQNPAGVFTGPLTVSFPEYNSYNSTVYTAGNSSIKLFHADKTTLFGSATSQKSISGVVLPSDQGILYMAADIGAQTAMYLDDNLIVSANQLYVKSAFGWDYLNKNVLSHGFKLDFSGLPQIAGGQTAQVATINMYCWNAGVPTAMMCQLNVTGISTSASYTDYTCTGYISSTMGNSFKACVVQLTLPDSGNATACDPISGGKVKNVWVSLGNGLGTSWTWSSYTWDLANKRFLFTLPITDTTQEYNALQARYPQGGTSNIFTWTVHFSAGSFAASSYLLPTLKITFINPAGTMTTVSRIMKFST